MKTITILLLILFWLAGCARTKTATSTPSPTVVATIPSAAEIMPTAEETEPEIVPNTAVTPITVSYFTPAQQEGPYYPVEKLADQDNDLVTLDGATGAPNGEILVFGGHLYDAAGLPVSGAVIEIWQTDSSGVYLHPNDPGTANRDPNFQFYGEAVTAVDGSYSFRTLLPGRYEPRPRHIHIKVKLAGQELLTTQFYFAGEVSFQGEEAGLVMALEPGQDEAGNPILVGKRDIILNQRLTDG